VRRLFTPPALLDTSAFQAAVSHIAVSNALLINGMFMPKFAPAALFGGALTGFSGFSAML
jgi:hypothetical protein